MPTKTAAAAPQREPARCPRCRRKSKLPAFKNNPFADHKVYYCQTCRSQFSTADTRV